MTIKKFMASSEASIDLYLHNLDALHVRDGGLAGHISKLDKHSRYITEETRSGSITAKIRDQYGTFRYIHSSIDPIKEATVWASHVALEAPAIAVLGFGLGYHLFALRKRSYCGSIIVIEADMQLFQSSMLYMNLAPTFQDSMVYWFVSKNLSTLNSLLCAINIDNISVLPFLPASTLCPEYYETTRSIIHEYLYEKRLFQHPSMSRGILQLMKCLQH